MGNPFTAHPHSVGESYGQHCRFAFAFGITMLLGGLAAVIHSLFPFLCVTTASRALAELNARLGRGARPPAATER
jgi:hypothetical protein